MTKKFFTDESLATFVNETKTYADNAVAELSSIVVYASDSNENVIAETDGTHASEVSYVNTASGLSSTNVQSAIDELSEETSQLSSEIVDIKAGMLQVEAPKIVLSIAEMTDTAKHYVLNGNIWAYMMHETVIPESNYNVFSYNTNNGSRINTRLSREGTESTTNGAKGSFITNYIELTDWNEYTSYNMYINFQLQSITLSATTAVFYDENKNVVGNVVGYEGSNADNITTTSTSSVFDLKRDAQQSGGIVNIPNAKYVRVQLFKNVSGTSLTTSDLNGVEIMLEANKTPSSTVQDYGWADTSISYTPTFDTDLIGVLGEGNVIYISDNLPSGTYTLKYDDETFDTIGTITVE